MLIISGVRRLERAAQRQTMSLVVVGQTMLGAQVEVILRRKEKGVAHVVNRLRQSVGDARLRPAAEAAFEGDEQAVVVAIARRLEARDVAEARIGPAKIRHARRGREARHVDVARKYYVLASHA